MGKISLKNDIFSIREGHLLKGVNKGSITFLFKARENENLDNWWPIFLINVAYKIYAKTLQLKFQPILMEVINCDQITFIPFWYILDNVLLV